jgi:hypothetical protein
MPKYLTVLLILAVVASGGMLFAQSTSKYAGSDNCKMCHPDIYSDWSKSAHSRGYDLLVNVGEEKNAACLACHVTGYGKGGFVDDAATPGLKGTTCEACHGPGADHMGDKSKITRVPPASTCGACHQQLDIHSLK